MKYIKQLIEFVLAIYQQRRVIHTLVIRDFEGRYLSSVIGLPWAFIQPAVFIFVIWFAFTFGLRSGDIAPGVPFAPWLIVALIPWLYINQTMIVSCSSLHEYSYLIKKTKFTISLIPMIKIFSGMLVHLILVVVIMFLLIFFYDITPTIYWLQIFYYLFAMMVLLTGIGWIVSALNLFVQDISHMVQVVVTMLFWATPIFWDFSMLEGNLRYVALLNPIFYITEGYRYTFLNGVWFWEYTEMNVLFWSFTLSIFIGGALIFRKMKPRFADVL